MVSCEALVHFVEGMTTDFLKKKFLTLGLVVGLFWYDK